MYNFNDREFHAKLDKFEILTIYVHGHKVYDDYYMPVEEFLTAGSTSVEILPLFNNLKFTGITVKANSDGLLIFFNSKRKFAYIEPYILFDMLRFTDTITVLNIIIEGKLIFNA